MSSIRNRSTVTKMCWMKKTTDAIIRYCRDEESVQVVLLQTHGEDGAILVIASLKSDRSLSSVRFRPDVLREIHHFFFVSKVLILVG